MEQEQNQDQELEQSNNLEQGSLDEAAEAFGSVGVSEEETEQEHDEGEDQQDTDSEEQSDEQQEDAEAEPELVAVEFDGKEYQVPKELEPALLMQKDYTKKTQELAQVRERAESLAKAAEVIHETTEQYAAELAKTLLIESRIDEFKALPWAKIREESPAEYAALSADFNTAQLALNDQKRVLESVRGQSAEKRNELLTAKRQEFIQSLPKEIQGWNEKIGTELTAYAVKNGYTNDQLAQITDVNTVKTLLKAMKYDQLQESKGTIREKVKSAPPVLKPGSVQKKVSAKEESIARLRKSNSLDDAAAAFGALG